MTAALIVAAVLLAVIAFGLVVAVLWAKWRDR